MPEAATPINITTTTMTRVTERAETTIALQLAESDSGSPHAAGSSQSLPTVALMAWLTPSFPVGSFAFSHGIEWAVEAGDVRDATSAADWIGALLAHGGPRNDAIVLANAWQAVTDGDRVALVQSNELALALAGSRERRLETTAQGNAFLAAVRAAWCNPGVDVAAKSAESDLAYPVAVAIAAAAHGIPRVATLEAFCLAVVQNLVSATIRLSAIGHSDGQRVIAASLPAALRLAHEAEHLELDDVGGAAFRSDIAALRHETQYTRLFRS